jgi:hypothetical protein
MESRDAIRKWAKKQVLNFRELWQLLWAKKLIVIVGAAVAIILLFFWSYIQAITLMAIFIVVGVVSLLYNRFLKVSLGIELNMLGIVIIGLLYGPLAAFIVGSITLFFAFVLTEHLTHASFVSFIGIAAVSFLIPVLSNMSITATGISLTIIYDVIIAAGYLALGSRLERTALFIVTHIPWNIWVFWSIAPKIYEFVG